jgi:drug/metabolite transporter (DMT)-like permease
MSAPHSRPLLGIGLVLGAGACFTLLDTTAKHVVATVPVLMALAVRYLLQAVFSSALLMAARQHAPLRTRRWGLQLLRGVLLLGSSVAALFSLKHIPLAEFTAIAMITPLVVSVIAVVVMKEKLDATGWVLLALSFAGTLLIVRPGGAASGWGAVFALICVAQAVAYQLVTGILGRSEHPTTTHLITMWSAAALFALTLPWSWSPVDSPVMWAWMALMALIGAVGHLLLAHAYRHAPASTLAPFHYASLLWATLLGWAVFGQFPDAIAATGMALIAACGLVNTRRQMRRAGRG